MRGRSAPPKGTRNRCPHLTLYPGKTPTTPAWGATMLRHFLHPDFRPGTTSPHQRIRTPGQQRTQGADGPVAACSANRRVTRSTYPPTGQQITCRGHTLATRVQRPRAGCWVRRLLATVHTSSTRDSWPSCVTTTAGLVDNHLPQPGHTRRRIHTHRRPDAGGADPPDRSPRA